MHRPATQGVEGSKPRLPGNGAPVTKEELGALNHEYLRTRNLAMAAKAESAEIALLERKGLLVSRRMVALQCAFLLTAFRQNLLSRPQVIAREMVVAGAIEPGQEHVLQQGLDGCFRKLLQELANLPARLMDPGWQDQIGADLLEQVTGEANEPRTPGEFKTRQAKAAQRRARKIETQRQRRAL